MRDLYFLCALDRSGWFAGLIVEPIDEEEHYPSHPARQCPSCSSAQRAWLRYLGSRPLQHQSVYPWTLSIPAKAVEFAALGMQLDCRHHRPTIPASCRDRCQVSRHLQITSSEALLSFLGRMIGLHLIWRPFWDKGKGVRKAGSPCYGGMVCARLRNVSKRVVCKCVCMVDLYTAVCMCVCVRIRVLAQPSFLINQLHIRTANDRHT